MDFHVARVAAPLRQKATESLRNAIAVGRFVPGQRLLERELCEMTGVSRTLVREALRQLEAEGLIVVSANRGPVVVKLTRKQAQDIYDVRCLLEGFAAEIVAEKGTPDQIARLQAAFEDLRRDIDSPEPLDRLLAKNRFYEELIEVAANEALGSTLRMLNSRITLLRSASLQHPGRAARSIAELEALMDAIRRRDRKAARDAAALHVRNAAETALRSFAD